MRGAVAAGHPVTAEAGARVLADGGNAVDACVAAAFVSWVAESPLTGKGAGGFMLVHRARDRSDRLLDFFVEAPGRGLDDGEPAPMEAIDVPFDDLFQRFYVGAPSCAVPGTVAGLGEAHRLYGRIPWPQLVAPAVEAARNGVEVTPEHAVLFSMLDAVLRRSPDGRRVYGASAPPAPGMRIVMPDLARTLEGLAADGPDLLYRGELGRRLSAFVREHGGRITDADLAAYRVIRRAPVRAPFCGHEFVSNPPPSAGGVLIAYALRVFERLGPAPSPGSVALLRRVAEVLREASYARGRGFATGLRRGGLAARLLDERTVHEAVTRVRAKLEPVREPVGAPSTTHVSVVDAAGNAASLSASTGCGSGVVVPGTGVHLNNMLGEEDLNPEGRRPAPGERLTSMMSPSLVVRGGRPRLVVGSAGSVRLRGAIAQIVISVIDQQLPLAEALAAPRIHADGDELHLEGGFAPDVAAGAEALGYRVVRWRGLNPYFGGASAVALDDAGRLEAAGDPRRGGAGIVVS
jgi:gamma-glutamyltranspeptidase / glutathione hydrolase